MSNLKQGTVIWKKDYSAFWQLTYPEENKRNQQQECFPVGCVPPASVAIFPVHMPPPMHVPAMHTPAMHAPCHTCPLAMHVPCHAPPLPDPL